MGYSEACWTTDTCINAEELENDYAELSESIKGGILKLLCTPNGIDARRCAEMWDTGLMDEPKCGGRDYCKYLYKREELYYAVVDFGAGKLMGKMAEEFPTILKKKYISESHLCVNGMEPLFSIPGT